MGLVKNITQVQFTGDSIIGLLAQGLRGSISSVDISGVPFVELLAPVLFSVTTPLSVVFASVFELFCATILKRILRDIYIYIYYARKLFVQWAYFDCNVCRSCL